jgi:small subunit ribosomal protein SAe
MFTRRPDGIFIIHIDKLWEKLILAARVIVCIQNGMDVFITSSSFHGRRPASKVSSYLGTSVNCGRFAPGTFTKSATEPLLLVCMDPRDDFQAVNESNKCNIPVIAFANSHSSLKYVDIAIPCNNVGSQSIGVMSWLLSRAVLRLKGALNYSDPWAVIPDMFFYNEEELQVQEEGIPYSGGSWGNKSLESESAFATGHHTKQNVEEETNWSSDLTPANASWDNQESTFDTNTFGSSDKTFDLNQFIDRGGTIDVDWAEDEPEKQPEQPKEEEQPVHGGWDATTPTNSNQQWSGGMDISWG